MSSDNTSTRIENLEARLAHQDHALHELSNEVYQQQQQIVRLEAMIKELVSRLKVVEQGQPGSGPADETPPHY